MYKNVTIYSAITPTHPYGNDGSLAIPSYKSPHNIIGTISYIFQV